MRILFLTYPRIGLNRGGLQIQIEETARGLSKLGVDVVRYDPWKNQIPDVDICHVFSIDSSMIYHVNRATSVGIPVVVSPVLNLFGSPTLISRMKHRMSVLPGVYSDLKRAAQILSAASRIIALNPEERGMLMTIFQAEPSKICMVPNGINVAFLSGNPRLFEEAYGVREFVLNVASIEPRKNQLSLVRAMRKLPHTLVLVGKASPEHADYFDKVKAEAGENVRFIGAIPHEDPMLAACYRAAKLFVLPSLSEVMPLTVNEAILAGCQVAVSDQVPVSESIVPHRERFRPEDVEAIARTIDRSMRQGKPNALASSPSGMPTWDEICHSLVSIYQESVSARRPSHQVVR